MKTQPNQTGEGSNAPRKPITERINPLHVEPPHTPNDYWQTREGNAPRVKWTVQGSTLISPYKGHTKYVVWADSKDETTSAESLACEFNRIESEFAREIMHYRKIEAQRDELLAALKGLNNAFEWAVPANQMRDGWRKAWREAQAAIAKAEGRAQINER